MTTLDCVAFWSLCLLTAVYPAVGSPLLGLFLVGVYIVVQEDIRAGR